MKVVTVPARQKFLSNLLMTVAEDGLVLQTSNGKQFVLFSLDAWHGFDVGESDDFEEEVIRTSENQVLIAFLTERKSDGKPISMKHVKERLGLN